MDGQITLVRQSFKHGPWFYTCLLCADDFGRIWQYVEDAQQEATAHEAACHQGVRDSLAAVGVPADQEAQK